MKKYIPPFLFLSAIPIFALAAENVLGLITEIKKILSAIIPVIMSLAVIYFIWSTAQYILKEGDKKNEAKGHMVWEIIIIFVMISVWGFVAILEDAFFGL